MGGLDLSRQVGMRLPCRVTGCGGIEPIHDSPHGPTELTGGAMSKNHRPCWRLDLLVCRSHERRQGQRVVAELTALKVEIQLAGGRLR